jgi:protein-S-isoprenylcysteine O-methyltransferase Ste14
MEKIAGFLSPLIVYIIIFLLNAILPGRWVTGYVTKTNTAEKLRYHLNGLFVLITLLCGWALLCFNGIIASDWFYNVRWYALAGAVTIGILFSLVVVVPYPSVKKSIFADFYLGRAENIQIWNGRIDAKMWLYLAGACMLSINILSFAAHHYLLYRMHVSSGIMVSTGLLMFFLFDYLTFEEIHLYTYDLFAERVGFKLGWGCIAFYPWFYAIPLWSTLCLPVKNTPAYLLVIYALIFFIGWALSRGANLQKYYFKKDPTRSFAGIVPKTISDGDKSLLVNGFWGLSRHINYLGEILMATGIVLCTGHASLIWPWFYPLYYVALLFPRQVDDNKRCTIKYGKLWDEYVQKVPYKIIPLIY